VDLEPGSKKNFGAKQARGNGKAAQKTRRAVAPVPEFVSPELATLDTEVPDGQGWLHEAKYDGYRIIGRKAGDKITLFSRSGLDWTVRFPAIADALLTFPAESALIDGEVAFVLASGLTDFKSLQEHIDSPHPAIRYFVFDLLSLAGKDLRKRPLRERRALLAKLMSKKGVSKYLVYADYVEGSGSEFFEQACAAGLEGIVSKRADAPYRSGRGKDWLKVKCKRDEEFVIGGYSRSDVKGKSFSSLLLGTFDGNKLVYSGKVGTGFDSADLDRLARKFKPLEQTRSPFEEVPSAERKGAVWLEPKLVAQIAFTEKTRDGRLRHPSFQGLREDKPAREVHREEPREEEEEAGMAKTQAASAKKGGDPTFHRIKLSNPGKVYYPGADLTKLDIAKYYETVAPFILPYVAKRPISLVRCPEGIEGERFFQRHAMKGMSKAIKQVPIPGGESKRPYLYIDDEEGLFGLIQIGTLEIHDWGVSLAHVSEPDRLVFDLDPDEGLDLGTLKAATVEVREFLEDLGFKSFLKSTGGKGLHLVAPLAPKLGWNAVKAFAKAIADALVSARPDRYTANPLKKTREGKIFVDYLRNQRGGSAIVNYSTRAKEGAPVACPLRWDELKALKAAAPYAVKTLPARLKAMKRDPWEGFSSTRQSITAKARKALGVD
jgi:bifunctional non-homologous end joining protein LigD